MHADKRKHPVFDLIPFARARRVMAHGDLQGQLVSEPLQMVLPGPVARAVAAPAVRADQQSARLGIRRPADRVPPTANAFDGEFGRVMRPAHVDQALVALRIVGPVGYCRAHRQAGKIIHVDFQRLALGPPLPTRVLKGPEAFFLFGVSTEMTGSRRAMYCWAKALR